MNTVSISQLKIRPAHVIAQAADYPVAVQSRHSVKAYLIGRAMYEKLIETIEDLVDASAVKQTNFKRGKNFEKIAAELGI